MDKSPMRQNKFLRWRLLHRLVKTIAVLITVSLFSFGLYTEFNIWRQHYYPELDKALGVKGRNPKVLLTLLQIKYSDRASNPYGLNGEEFYEAQKQALLRLLDLQVPLFNNNPMSEFEGQCAGYESPSLDGVRHNKAGNLIVTGTTTFFPDRWDGKNYSSWGCKALEFTPEGRLVNWSCPTAE